MAFLYDSRFDARALWIAARGLVAEDSGCPPPPSQSRAGATNAHGSYLGFGIFGVEALRGYVAIFGLAVEGCPGRPESGPSSVAALASTGAFVTTCAALIAVCFSRSQLPNRVILKYPPHLLARATSRLLGDVCIPVAVWPAIRELGCHALADRLACTVNLPVVWLVPQMWVKPRK